LHDFLQYVVVLVRLLRVPIDGRVTIKIQIRLDHKSTHTSTSSSKLGLLVYV